MNRVLIFDLDGTLVDSRHDILSAVNHALAAIGRPPTALDRVEQAVGDGVARLLERMTPDASAAQRSHGLAAFTAYYATHCHDFTLPYPGIIATLAHLHEQGWKMAVATNKPLIFTRAILDACELGPFAAIRGGDGPRKPDPGQLTSILDELEAQPIDSWMIGDHHTDILAGKAAGCRVLWCAWGIGRRDGLAVDAQARMPAEIITRLMV